MDKAASGLTLGALLLVWVAASSPLRRARTADPILAAEVVETVSPIPLAPAPEPGADLTSLVRRLPDSKEELRAQVLDWCRLEAEILRDPEYLRESLWARYEAEADPGYKGLLAVLLGVDASTHDRILKDHRTYARNGWELFHGMAIYALVRPGNDSPEAAMESANRERWEELFVFVNLAQIEVESYRELRTTGRFGRGLNCSSSMMQLDRGRELARHVRPVWDEDLRSDLIREHAAAWDWDWITNLAGEIVARSAEADPVLAARLAQDYLGSGSEKRAYDGLDLLGSARLPDECLNSLDRWARTAVDRLVYWRSVYLLGHQPGVSSERILGDLYGFMENRPDRRSEVLIAMKTHGGASFQGIAEIELRSGTRDDRVASLGILHGIGTESCLKTLLSSIRCDADPKVRYAGLLLLRDRTRSSEEERVLQSARSDPDSRVRSLAEALAPTVNTASVKGDIWTHDWNRPDPETSETLGSN